LSQAVNTTHAAGVGTDSSTGNALFTQPTQVTGAAHAMAIDPGMAGHPERVAAAANASDLPGGNDNALALAAIGSKPLAGGGTPAQRFGALAANVGAAKSAADAEQKMRADTLTTANNAYESASGVSLDEEMVNVTKFQRAFEASQQVLRTADELLDGLMKA